MTSVANEIEQARQAVRTILEAEEAIKRAAEAIELANLAIRHTLGNAAHKAGASPVYFSSVGGEMEFLFRSREEAVVAGRAFKAAGASGVIKQKRVIVRLYNPRVAA